MSRVAMGHVSTLLSRRCKQLQRKSQQRNYRKLFVHRPGMEGLEPRLLLASDLLVADVVSDSILRFAGNTGAPLGPFVTSGSGGLVDPLDPEFGPDGNLYVISNDPGHVKVLRYNGSSGASLGTFVDLGAGSASAIEFGPDGNLYLATISETGVLRFNGTSGESMGVAASGNGIRRASGISFGPDGKLYVLDSDRTIETSEDRVLRFDPSNGAFIDQFVTPGYLNDAVFLTFGPDNNIYVPDIRRFHDVRLFSGVTGAFLGVFANSPEPTNNPIFDIQFGSDGNAYAATGNGILRLDGETGRLLDTFVDGTGGSITFFPPAGPATDLSVSLIDIPEGVVQGSELSITYTIINNSPSATVVNSWDDVVYLSTDDVFDPNDEEFGRIAHTTGLAGGASYTETLNASLPSVSLGVYHLFVFADRRGVVNDPARLNNLLSATGTLEVFPLLASTHDPAHSIAVGRTLSAYTTTDVVNNTLTVTYTVYNLTDGYAQGTLLTTTLGSGVTFVNASIMPDRNGQELAWSMGTLAPYGRTSVVVSVALANASTLQIDSGAKSFATLDTVAVSDIAPGAKLRTDIITPDLLASTPDANTTDPFVMEKAAELDYDPQKIFDFLQTEIGYESYDGSLRGARGTLWSHAGNSLDEASLGVALMRASGIPARYVRGVLADGPSQQLILSMFPDTFQVVGYIPPDTEVADPANDSQLLAETRDHYWFQFNAGAGFQDADSTFASAAIGQTFHNGTTSGFTEVAEALRHKTTIQLTAEIYSQASASLLPGSALSQTVVLDKTFNDVDLVGRPLTVGYFVNMNALSSLAFAFQSTTYTPYVIVSGDSFDALNDETVPGKPFQEILTNFPLSNQLVTGLFLTMNLVSPNGTVQSYQRTLADRFGTAARANGSTAVSISADLSPIATPLDLTTISVLTSRYDPNALLAQNSVLDALQQQTVNYKSELDSTSPGPKLNQLQASATTELRSAFVAMGRSRLAQFAVLSDSTTDTLQTQARVRAFFVSPRVMLFSTALTTAQDGSSTIQFAMDLRKDDIRVLAAPANATSTTAGFSLMRAFAETVIETQALGTPPQLSQNSAVFTGPVSESTILEATTAQGIPLLFLTRDQIGVLNALLIPGDVKALVSGALQNDQFVLIPASMVLINGTPQIAWYEIDPSTGRTTGVGQNGLHSPLVSYTATQQEGTLLAHLEGFGFGVVGGASLTGYKRIIEYLLKAFIPIAVKGLPVSQETANVIDALKKFYFFWNNVLPKIIIALSETASPSSINRSIAAGFLTGLSIAGAQTADPPVNTFLSNPNFSLLSSEPNVAKSKVLVSNEVLPGNTSASLSLSNLAVKGQISASWNARSSNAFLANSLSSPLATILDSDGNTIGSGSVMLASLAAVPVVVSGNIAYTVEGQGSLSFYTPTNGDVGASGDWTSYSASASGTVALSLNTAALLLNGNVLPAGSYRIIAGSAALAGSGRSTSPNFTGSVSIAADNAGLELGKGIGSLSVGGAALDPRNGAALADFSGNLSVSLGSGGLYIVALNGSASNLLQVSANSTMVTASQNAPATFHINFHTSQSGAYVLAVEAPKGWNVTISGDTVSVTPAPGVQTGNFPIHIVAGSLINPDLVAQAELTVAVSPTVPAIDVTVTPDSILYVPVNGGQLPSAFRAHIQNLGPNPETLDLTFNAPPGFEVISSMSTVTVPAGKTATVGFFFQPTGLLLPPGSNVSFSVTAISLHNVAITDTESVAFVMPEVHGVTLTAAPASISTIPGVSVDAAFVVKAAGNVTENITFDVSLSPGLALAGLTNVSLSSGQSSEQTLHFTPLANTPLNSTLQATITANFNGREPVTITIPVRVVVAGSDAIDNAGNAARSLGKTDLANRLSDLSIALTNLVQAPTSAIFKSQSLASLGSIESLLLVDQTLVSFSAPLANAADGLANANTASEIQIAVVALGAVLDNLAKTVVKLSQHNFELFLTPNSQVALPQSHTQFELRIHNIGKDTSTYNVALQGVPAGVTATLSDQQLTLERDGFATVLVTLTQTSANELLEFGFSVDVSVDGAPQVSKSASGTLTARREFVSVVSVSATPPFTDAGGTLDASARLLNAVNREQQARASFVVRDSAGTQVGAASSPVDVTLTVQTSLATLPLGSFDTTGLANGSYSIVMTLVDVDGQAIPGGTGSTTFLVGSPLTASIDAMPSLLPPGTSTVTNTLKIEALTPLVSPLTLVGQVPINAGLRGVAARGNMAYASGTNGIQIIDYADPENPTIVGTIPGNHLGARIQDNVLLALRPEGRSFYLDVYALKNTPLAPPLIGSSPLIRYDLADDLTSNSTHAFIGTLNYCVFLGSQDIYRQLGDQLAIKLNLDSIDNPTTAAPTLDSVLSNTHGDNSFDPSDVSGCAESGGDHMVFGVHLATPSTTYVATTTATQGDTQNGVGRIRVVDVTDGSKPIVLKNLDIPGTVLALGVGVSGNVGVVVGSTQGFQDNPGGVSIGNLTVTTLDVTDPLDPKIVTTRTVDLPSSTFWVNFTSLGGGRFAFSSQGIVGNSPIVLVIDASNPRSPLIGHSSIPIDLIAPNSLSTDGNFLFTADSGGVSIYSVNPLPGLPVTARVQIPYGTGVAPVLGSFNIPPAEVISGSDFDTYVFDLTLAPSLPSETLTWQSTVVDLQPGESRPVTLGTAIDFTFQGTVGQVALPRTVVAAEQVLSLDSGRQSVRPGDAAEFSVTFTNPAPVDVTYDLSVGGVPKEWVGIDSTVTVPAGETITKVLRLATGSFDVVGDYGFVVNAVVDSVTTSVAGTLMLVGAPILPEAKPDSQGIVVTLTPTSAIAGQGTAATYVARLTNVGSQADEFVLSAAGLPSGFQTTFAINNINVPPGASNFRDVVLTIIPPQGTAADDYAFTVTATSASDTSIADVATGALSVLDIGVAVDVTPESGPPESTYLMLVTNTGQVRETFDLSLAAPAALMATLGASSVTLEPGQSTSVPIDVDAIDFAFPGSLSLVGVATSRSNPLVRAADGVGVNIAGLIAMTAAFDKSAQVLPLPGTSSFLLLVDNIGNIEDQYSATIKSTTGPITANLVGLQGESTQSVPLFILPGLSRGAILLNAELLSEGLGTITIMVKSLTDASVSTEITAQLQAGQQADQFADLSLVMTVDNASAKVGQNVTFTIALNNAGPDNATGVSVLDKLPAGLQFLNATTSTGSYSAATGLWNVGNLPQGATTTLTIVAKLLTDQEVSNVAQVATSDQRDPDSTPGNNVVGEDDQFSADVGTCLTGGPLVAGINRLVFSCVTPGGFAAFVVGTHPGSHHYSQWGTTVDIADPGVPAIGVGNIKGVAVVLVNLTQAQLARPLYVQAFEMLPAHKVSNLIVAQHAPAITGTPLLADTNRLMSESLSPGMRQLPTAVTSPSFGALDVNRDGFVSPMDVLLVINELNLSRGRFARTTVAGNVLDVTGDGMLTPNDALQVINHLNLVSSLKHSLALGEGESSVGVYDSDRGSYSALESFLVDDSLLEALATDAVNAWLEAKRNSRWDN